MKLKFLLAAFLSFFLIQIKAQVHIDVSTIFGNTDYDESSIISTKVNDTIFAVMNSTSGTTTNDFPVTNGVTASNSQQIFMKINAKTGAIIFAGFYCITSGSQSSTPVQLEVIGNKVYIVGQTSNSTYPVTNGSTLLNFGDIFFTILDASNGNNLYSTFIGGTGTTESVNSMKVVNNEVHLIGMTRSSNFPVTNSSTFGGLSDMFYMKRNASNGALIFSTFIGGSGAENAQFLELDGGIVHIFGQSSSANFPVTNGSTYSGSPQDWAYLQLNANNGSILHAQLLGSNGQDLPTSMVLSGGYVYLGGSVRNGFPVTTGAVNQGSRDIAIVKIDASSKSMVFSTLLGSTTDDNLISLKVVGSNIHLIGNTNGLNYPIVNGFNRTSNIGMQEIIYSKLNANNGNILTSTFLGGNNNTLPSDFIVNGNEVSMIGTSSSTDFPVTNNTTLFSTSSYDVFYLKINSNNSKVINGTYLGGVNDQRSYKLFLLNNNRFSIIGSTNSPNFPTTNNTKFLGYGGLSDVFYTVLNECTSKFETSNDKLLPSKQTVCRNSYADPILGKEILLLKDSMPAIYRDGVLSSQIQQEAKYQWQSSANATGPWNIIIGAIDKNYQPSVGTVTQYFRRLSYNSLNCNEIVSISSVDTIEVNSFTSPVLNAGGVFNTCPGSSIAIGGGPTASGGQTPYTYSWIAGNDPAVISTIANPSVAPSTGTIYTLTVTDGNNCRNVTQAIVNTYSANAGNNTSNCNGDSVRIQAEPIQGLAGTTYSWSPSTGLGCTNCIQPKALTTSPTTYTLTMTINKTGGGTCATTDDVIVSPVVVPSTADFAGVDRVVCFGTNASLGTPIEYVSLNLSSVSQSSVNVNTGTLANLTNSNFADGASTQQTVITSFSSVTQSSVNGFTGSVTNLNDLDFSSGARTNAGIGEFIMVDLGSETWIGGVQLSAITSANLNGKFIQISRDGTNWFNYGGALSGMSNSSLVSVYSGVNSGRYVRIRTNTNSIVDLSELRIIVAQNITFDLGRPHSNVTRIEASAITTANLNSSSVQVSADGVTWTNIGSIITSSNSSLQTYNFTNPNSTRYLRVIKNSSTPLELSEIRIYQEFKYTWAPGSYLTSNNTSTTTYNSGTLTFPPNPDSAVYYLTAERLGCVFTDAVTVSVIRASAGVDGCGPRIIGGDSDVPTLNETFAWSILSGGGTITGATNTPTTIVSASPTGNPTTYRLTTTYRGVSCTDDVYVPDCLCGVNIQVDAPFGCPNFSSGTVKLIASSNNLDNQNYDFSWSPTVGLSSYTDAVVTLTDNVSRTYTVTITNKFDNSISCTETIDVNHPSMTYPVFKAKDTTICPGQTVNIGQANVAGYNYLWSPVVGLSSFNNSNPSTSPTNTINYAIKVTDIGTGCYTLDTANITVQNAVANAGPDWTVCNSSAIVRLGGETPRAHHKYKWTPAQSNWQSGSDSTTAQPYVLVAVNTTFTLTATDTLTGCSISDQVDIVINNTPTIDNAPNISICKNVRDTIGSLTNALRPGVTFSWSPSTDLSSSTAAMPIANPSSTTTYTLTMTFPGGCTATDDVIVTVNDASFTMPNINYCPSSGAVALGAFAPNSMLLYNWTPSILVSSPNSQNTNTLNPPPSQTTTYTLTVVDNNGCQASSSLDIIPSLTAPIAGNNRTMCLSDKTTTLGSSSNVLGGSISYAWSPSTGLSNPSSHNPVFTPTAAGKYTFTVTKTDASIPCSSTDVVTITVNDYQLPVLTQPTLCLGSSIQIGTTSAAGASYLWTPGSGLSDSTISNPIANPSVSSVYNLISVGSNGCIAKGTVAVSVNNTPAPTITIPTITNCLANLRDTFRPVITPAASYNYSWTPNDGSLNNASVLNPAVTFTGVGSRNYTLVATNSSNGCSNSAIGTVIVNTNCPPVLKGSLGNFVWLDLDKDGVQDIGEPGVAGVAIDLFKNGTDNLPGTSDDILIGSTKTDAYGFYGFDNLDASNYNLKITPPINYNFTTQSNTTDSTAGTASATAGSDFSASSSRTYSINLYAGENEPKIDAGLIFAETTTASIGDKVWFDENNNGIQDASESGLAGVTVTLYNSAGNPVATTMTDAQGYYLFDNLTPANYRVGVTLPMSTKFSGANLGGNDDIDSDLDPNTGRTGLITLAANQAIRSVDIGITPIASSKASLGDKMWIDIDQDGIQDASEIGIANTRVRLYDNSNNLLATTQTDAYGNYMFTDLDPGDYVVNFDLPSGYVFTTQGAGSDSFLNSNPNVTTGTTSVIKIQAGDRNLSIDAGVYQSAPTGTASLGDKVWFDIDADGIQDSDEGGVAGITVTLYNNSGTAIGTTTTDINGNYSFVYLPAGDYSVGFSNIPKEYTMTTQTNGTANGSDANPATGRTPLITLSVGQNFPDLDLGLIKGTNAGLASLGNFVWNDVDQDGIQDVGEFGVPGIEVTLNKDLNNDGDFNDAGEQNISTTITDGSGYYSFPSLAAGTYQVIFKSSTIPAGFIATSANTGGNDNLDSDGVLGSLDYESGAVTLSNGEDNTSLDFGIYVNNPSLGSIGNFVWIDKDGDGVQDAGETGLPGVQVTLYDGSGNVLKVMTTDANGGYLFDALPAGSYTVGISNIPSGFNISPARTTSSSLDSDIDPITKRSNIINLIAGQDNMTIDAGLVPTKAVLGNYVWRDNDGDGLQDAGEPGISGVTVILYDGLGNAVASTITDASGFYLFPNLDQGTYTVGFSTIPNGLLWTIKDANTGTDLTDSDVNPITGRTSPVTLVAGDVNLSLDAGLRPAILEVGNYVWLDEDNDGNQDATEKGVPGMIVKLYSVGGDGAKGGIDDVLMGTTITDGSGKYLFTNVPAGSYYAVFSNSIPSYPFTLKDNVADGLDSDADITNGETAVFTMTNANNYTIDAGIQGSINALPLNYVFKATKVNQTALLEWEVFYTNSNILNYQIYRSTDGVNYEVIGNVKHSNSRKISFLDKNPALGINFYKINIITESEELMTYVRVLNFNNSNTSIVAYPNPTNGLLQINSEGLTGETVNILIVDVLGKEIFNKTYSNFIGFESVNLKDFAEGVYQIKVTADNNQYNQKIILAK